MAAWMDAGSPNGSKIFAVPITKFQSDVLRSLAAQRSPDSYIAGGVAINREGPRFSADIDIFHDSEARLEGAARADAAVLTAEGYLVVPGRTRVGTLKINEFALKGPEADQINLALLLRKIESAQFRPATIRPCFHHVSLFDLPRPSGRDDGGRFPGLKPWAES
jgi:hypothetical protein